MCVEMCFEERACGRFVQVCGEAGEEAFGALKAMCEGERGAGAELSGRLGAATPAAGGGEFPARAPLEDQAEPMLHFSGELLAVEQPRVPALAARA